MNKFMLIGEVVVNLEKISGVLKNDTDVNHLGTRSTSTHNFSVILDGAPVKISFFTIEERDTAKAALFVRLGGYEQI